MDIICRWRDAITDPPPEGIMCIVRRGDIRDHRFRFGGLWFDPGGDNFDPAAVTDGDQWLDVTDVPAVAVAKVRDAVDEIHEIYINGAHDESRCADSAMDIIKAHTGVAHV